MKPSCSFKAFRRRIGYVPIGELWSEVKGAAGAFLMIYLFSLLFMLLVDIPIIWTGNAVLKVFGIPKKVVPYAIVALVAICILKNRRTFFAWTKGIQRVRDESFWIIVLIVGDFAIAAASVYWLPFWAAWGVCLGLMFTEMLLDKADQLGQKYEPPQDCCGVDPSAETIG